MAEPDTFVSPGRIARRLGVTPRTVARWADRLQPPDVILTPGGHRRIAARVADQWAVEQPSDEVAA